MYDIVIRNGTVIDGRDRPRYRTDIGIQEDRITTIGDLSQASSQRWIDATGHVVAPGFIDVHTHSDAWLMKEPHFLSKTAQGFTTEFLMLDGISYAPVDRHTARQWIYYLRSLNGLQMDEYGGWCSIAEYMALLHKRTAQNTATFIPYANVRTLACGFGQRFPDDYQLYEIKRLIQQGMDEGALGISTGLDYIDECFATTDELVAACQMMAPQGVYVTHVRYALGTLAGVQEAVEIGRRANVAVHISHLKATDAEEAEMILNYISNVAVNEVDFSFDVYPYLPSSTMLQYLLPHEVWLEGPIAALRRLTDARVRSSFNRTLADTPLEKVRFAWVGSKGNHELQGQSLAEYVAGSGRSAADALCDLLISEGMAVLLLFDLGEDDLVAPFLAHPRYMLGSDGIYFPDGAIHPRHYGSAARLLGRYAREQALFSLESAVHKLSGFPAARFQLESRGELIEGNFADIVVFDPRQVRDLATYDKPHQLATGVRTVLVNGQIIIDGGKPVVSTPAPLPGQFLQPG